MSKNQDRYKEDYTEVDIERLDELDTEKFEKFHPKKQDKKRQPKNLNYEIDYSKD